MQCRALDRHRLMDLTLNHLLLVFLVAWFSDNRTDILVSVLQMVVYSLMYLLTLHLSWVLVNELLLLSVASPLYNYEAS